MIAERRLEVKKNGSFLNNWLFEALVDSHVIHLTSMIVTNVGIKALGRTIAEIQAVTQCVFFVAANRMCQRYSTITFYVSNVIVSRWKIKKIFFIEQTTGCILPSARDDRVFQTGYTVVITVYKARPKYAIAEVKCRCQRVIQIK